MDESGDLGFDFAKRGTSKFFVVTLLYVIEKRPIDKVVSKTLKDLHMTSNKGENVIHSSRSNATIRTRLLKRLNSKDIEVFTICIDKRKVSKQKQLKTSGFYNFITRLLLDTISDKGLINGDMTLIASRRETSRYLNQQFVDSVRSKISGQNVGGLEIIIKLPQDEKCLQAVDFICWSVFKKYENGDEKYYNLIKSKILEEHDLLA
jgi:hypothetical protein